MTSGIAWTEPLYGMPYSALEMERSSDWVKFVLDRPMSSAPGDGFNYNSGNPHVLSAILTKLTGMSTLEYAKAKLFGPLGITDVFWAHDPQGISIGGYGMYLQPRDMAKIGYLYLRKGVWEGKQLLPPAWIDKVAHATVNMQVALEPELRYSNLFWALPDKHVYMAVGDIETYARDGTKSGPRFTGPIGLDGLCRKGELTYHGLDTRFEGYPGSTRSRGLGKATIRS
jgi:CubicO group peptidase (beta-lactamase class C family)